MKYGLIGKTLKHSYSKIIHEQLVENYTYNLCPLDEKEFKIFMKLKPFQAINVTIPYKQNVMSYLDWIDDRAKKINAVNTIINKEGKLYGYNTDYDGFMYTIQKHNIQIKNKKVLILGDGGASQAVQSVIADLKAKEIIIANRTKKENTISFEKAVKNHDDAQIIINTTPVGMYPDTHQSVIDLVPFMRCEAVIDCIYNPMQTQFISQAKQLKIPIAISGMEMLVAQAVKALEIFKNITISEKKIEETYKNIMYQTTNIIITGSDYDKYKNLAQILHKNFIQTMDISYALKNNYVIVTDSIESQDWTQNGWIIQDDTVEHMIQEYKQSIEQL